MFWFSINIYFRSLLQGSLLLCQRLQNVKNLIATTSSNTVNPQ